MSNQIMSTPKTDGYRMPGEFEPHAACWMIWPERLDNWRNGAKPAQAAFTSVAEAISKFEPVIMCVSKESFDSARSALNPIIKVVIMESDDAWMRDVGPTFVVNGKGQKRGIDWRFNAWGGHLDGLYSNWEKDDQIAKKVCGLAQVDFYSLKDFILEGGAIHVDGEGTAIVTEACLLHESRNPDLEKSQIEDHLKQYLNVEKVIWLKHGIYLDETNEHVDNILHYCAPAVVALAWTDDPEDPQYNLSLEAYEVLSHATDAKGRSFEIHKLHIPTEITISNEEANGVIPVGGTLPRRAGDRQAASYANFYIANGGIIMPFFGDEKYDTMAKASLEKIFPDRTVVGVYSREIILGGGNIHCITQQEPI